MLKILKFLFYLICLLFIAWGSLALYYSDFIPPRFSTALAVLFAAYSIYSFWFAGKKRKKRALVAWGVVFIAIAAHWAMIKPSHDRAWRADMARMPQAVINGDTVKIVNYRNFEYRGLKDFTPRYEEREVQLSHLTSVDFFISYWVPGPVAHTFLSFNFDNSPPVCISIEARYEEDEGFDPLASLFKEFELIYIVGSEKDIVGVRTNFRHEDVYMYRIRMSPESARLLFMVYMQRINELADKPEFYHLLSNNCTINIVRYANLVGREGRLDIRLILNGYSDRYLYRNGYIDTSLPFVELRALAYINPLAQQAGNAADFSERIRQSLVLGVSQ